MKKRNECMQMKWKGLSQFSLYSFLSLHSPSSIHVCVCVCRAMYEVFRNVTLAQARGVLIIDEGVRAYVCVYVFGECVCVCVCVCLCVCGFIY